MYTFIRVVKCVRCLGTRMYSEEIGLVEWITSHRWTRMASSLKPRGKECEGDEIISGNRIFGRYEN